MRRSLQPHAHTNMPETRIIPTTGRGGGGNGARDRRGGTQEQAQGQEKWHEARAGAVIQWPGAPQMGWR